MEFVQYGNREGPLVVYFHGAPGAVEECAVFAEHAEAHNLNILCFDRFSIDLSLEGDSYYQEIADAIQAQASGKGVDIVGFSIGAHVALEVGTYLKSQLRSTHLISAAAPLNAADFIGNMAGGIVFKLAMQRPFLFSLLAHYQKLMAKFAPGLLVNMLFTSAAGEDKALSKQDNFKSTIKTILSQCFQYRLKGYMRDINNYVTWSGDLGEVRSNVCLWHGTEDNWSPYAMASCLAAGITGDTRIEAMEGLSHYSCLQASAPKICAELQDSMYSIRDQIEGGLTRQV